VAVNPNTNLIYVTIPGSHVLSVIDGASNTVVATVALGTGPTGVAVNPNTNRIYVANSNSDNVSVIDAASNTVVATVDVGSNPVGVAVNPNTNLIYVENSLDDVVSVIEDIVPPTPNGTFTTTPRPATPTPPNLPGVGSKVMLPPTGIAAESGAPAGDSGWTVGAYAALAGAAVAVAIGGWYARRRWRAG